MASDTNLFVDKECSDQINNKTNLLLNKSFSAIEKMDEIETLSKTDSIYSLTTRDEFHEPDSTLFEANKKMFNESNKIVKNESISKLTKLNRSISSSILSINKFKKKMNRQSMCHDHTNLPDFSQINNVSVSSTRKILTSKNLLRQIENLHEQTGKSRLII